MLTEDGYYWSEKSLKSVLSTRNKQKEEGEEAFRPDTDTNSLLGKGGAETVQYVIVVNRKNSSIKRH